MIADRYAADIIHLENLDVSANGVNGINDSILHIYPAGGLVLDDSIGHDNANAFAAVHVQAQYTGLPVLIVNNTITANAGPGLSMQVYTEQRDLLANNVFWNNGTSHLVIDSDVGNERPAAFNNLAQLQRLREPVAGIRGQSQLRPEAHHQRAEVPPRRDLCGDQLGHRGADGAPDGRRRGHCARGRQCAGSRRLRDEHERLTGHTYLVTSNADDAGNILTLRADASGAITLNLNVPQPNFSSAWVTATQEGYTAGSTDTSEISNSRLLKQADDIYYDGFDCY